MLELARVSSHTLCVHLALMDRKRKSTFTFGYHLPGNILDTKEVHYLLCVELNKNQKKKNAGKVMNIKKWINWDDQVT